MRSTQADVQMVDPNDPKFSVAWQAFSDEVRRAFNDHELAQTWPLPERQDRYAIAIWATAELLYSSGERDLAMHFHLLAEAMHDLAEGKDHPLFKIEKKRGRQSDTNEIWRLRASLCIGIQYLIASRMERDKVIALVARKYGAQLQKLLRSRSRLGSDLKTSIPNWLKTFATDACRNDAAQWTYTEEMRRLKEIETSKDDATLRQRGLTLIERTALRAGRALKI